MADSKRLGILDVAHRGLRWVQPRTFSQAYELRTEDAVVATLTFRSAFSSLATGESRLIVAKTTSIVSTPGFGSCQDSSPSPCIPSRSHGL